MELNIINPDSNDFCEALGIGPDRQKELSGSLDDMVRRLNTGPVQLVKMHQVFAHIASFCNNEEELLYCTVLHCGWHARKGKILAPGPLDYGVIGQGITMLTARLYRNANEKDLNILKKLLPSKEERVIKEGAREGVQRLLDLKEVELAKNIMDKLTGFAF